MVLLYLAETSDSEFETIVVKFTTKYGKDLYQFCPDVECAPKRFAFETLSGGWFGIATEYIPSSPHLYEHGESSIKEMDSVVEKERKLHANGFVHGDLRFPNLIVCGDMSCLVDFKALTAYAATKENVATLPNVLPNFTRGPR